MPPAKKKKQLAKGSHRIVAGIAKRETPHLRLRLDADLLDALEGARIKNGRTLTGEITHRLDKTFQEQYEDNKWSAAQSQLQLISQHLAALTFDVRKAAGLADQVPHREWWLEMFRRLQNDPKLAAEMHDTLGKMVTQGDKQ